MKKFLLLAIIAVMACGSASAQKGEMAIGGNLLYGTEINMLGIGGKFQYGITNDIRGEASFNYYFPNDGFHMWDLNANAHYLFDIAPKFRAYPLAGLTVVSKSYTHTDESVTHFGLNLGGGCEYDITPNVIVNAEFKYSIVSSIDQAVFLVGAAYKF
jgi:outer membrane protein X